MTDLTIKINPKDVMKRATENLKEEIMQDQVDMIRDYIKGLYWFRRDKEKEIAALTKEIEEINAAIAQVEKGDIEEAKKIKVPAKYISEKTARMNDMDWETE